jgi:hypothetical protein
MTIDKWRVTVRTIELSTMRTDHVTTHSGNGRFLRTQILRPGPFAVCRCPIVRVRSSANEAVRTAIPIILKLALACIHCRRKRPIIEMRQVTPADYSFRRLGMGHIAQQRKDKTKNSQNAEQASQPNIKSPYHVGTCHPFRAILIFALRSVLYPDKTAKRRASPSRPRGPNCRRGSCQSNVNCSPLGRVLPADELKHRNGFVLFTMYPSSPVRRIAGPRPHQDLPWRRYPELHRPYPLPSKDSAASP